MGRIKAFVTGSRAVRWAAGVVFCLSLAFVHHHWMVILNQSPSLPNRAFVMTVGEMPTTRGQYVAFVLGTDLDRGPVIVKRIAGIPGDMVTERDREFFVNGLPTALAKTHSLKGEPLALGPVGIIPAGHFFVVAPHKDSYDFTLRENGLDSYCSHHRHWSSRAVMGRPATSGITARRSGSSSRTCWRSSMPGWRRWPRMAALIGCARK